MAPTSTPEQQAFERTLEQTRDVLEDLAQESLIQVQADLDDSRRDDAW